MRSLPSLPLFNSSRLQKADSDPFPASGEVTGWQKTDETRVFAAKDLWQYIDGDAEQYIQAGVVSTSTSDYKYQAQMEAVVDVHTMRDAAGAGKIMETAQARTPSRYRWATAALPTRRASSFAKGHTWSASLPISPTPMVRRRCWLWRMAWKRNSNSGQCGAASTNARMVMESRREFLKEAATGAVLLGAQGKWGLARAVESVPRPPASPRL